ncbi:PIR Superfamily Protein [Plasmodium ovale wallikeri]|uniref:PIR Superfamily Protein n=1 Tax=Plasmodium ovale wallikeri TaxID=864142 RepID=A0A1A9AI35_PLAOA|nr:PIR Superfamily Protein [Plasmodium ovale wallikeri]
MAKPAGSSHFTYDSFEKHYAPLSHSKISKIYNILLKSCTSDDEQENGNLVNVCSKYKIEEEDNEYVTEFLQKLIHNLKNTYLTANNLNNVYFKETLKDIKQYCIYFKYWLYDQILSNSDYKTNITKIYQEWEKEIKQGVNEKLSYHCTFNKLDWNEIEDITSIYAFKLIFYDNINIFNNEINIPCMYLSDLGKGLKAYYQSITKCSIDNDEDKYCKEFKEFLNMYNLDKLHLKFSENSDYQFREDDTGKCPLVIESLNDPLHVIYKKGKNRWHLSDQPIDSLKSSIISASSAIGATAGISAFLLYLFKFTNIGSLFGHGNKKNNTMFLNVDQETNDFTFPISAPEHNNFGNNEYKISYYSSDNS